MAHFYGTIKGNGLTKSTRCGTKKTGIKTTIASWDGAIEVEMWYDSTNKVNRYKISEIPWGGIPKLAGQGKGQHNLIKKGIIGVKE
jgi:hypothetical protein